MHTRFLVRASFVVVSVASLFLCGACHVDANVKASANANEPLTDHSDDPKAGMPAAAPVTAVAAPAPTAPPADACPLVCYAARGAEKANLTAEEVAQLRTSLEPVLGRMRTCTSPDEWRRYGSPFVNLRIGPDGSLNDLGVDAQDRREATCFDDAGRGANVSVSLPSRQVVRCAERCAREASVAGARRGRRAR